MKFTIVGPKSVYPERKNLKEGDKLTFKKILSSEYGKTVEVYNEKNVQIGFVAARESTSEPGTYLAEDVFDNERFSETFYGEIISINPTSNKIIAEAKAEIELKEETTNMEQKKVSQRIVTAIDGNKKIYPYKYAPFKLLKEGKQVPAKLELNEEENKLVVKFNMEDDMWVECGHVIYDSIEGTEYKTYKEILNAFKSYKIEGDSNLPETEAVITSFYTTEEASQPFLYVLNIDVYGQSIMDEILVNIKGLEKEDVESLKNFLETLNLSQDAINECFNLLKNNLPQDPSRIPEEVIFNNYDEVVEDVIYSIISNENTMLSGPMASGKNTLLEMLASKFKKALYEIQVNSYIDNDVLLGTKTIKARETAANKEKINEECRKLVWMISQIKDEKAKEKIKDKLVNGDQETQIETISSFQNIDFSVLLSAIKSGDTEVDFLPSTLVVAMEKGSWVVVDEFNTGPASVMSVLNSVLDDRKRIQVPGYGLVQAAPGFRFFGTMNPDYEGTFNLNAATASRFNFVLCRPADRITPIILSRVPSLKDKNFLNACEKLYKKIRDSVETGKLNEEALNPRGFIKAAKQVMLGRTAKKALINCIANGVTEIEARNAIRNYIEIDVRG